MSNKAAELLAAQLAGMIEACESAIRFGTGLADEAHAAAEHLTALDGSPEDIAVFTAIADEAEAEVAAYKGLLSSAKKIQETGRT